MSFSRFAGLEPKFRLDDMALDLANFLEALDYISLPIPANQYYDLEKGLGEISHRHVAMAAGIGRLGRGGLSGYPPVWRGGSTDYRADNSQAQAGFYSRRESVRRLPSALCFHLPG